MFPEIKKAYLNAVNKIFFLDYDGTLVPFAENPVKAFPDPSTRESLEELSRIAGNSVVIISGRDKIFLDKVFDGMELTLIAEHGFFMRLRGKSWKKMSVLHNNWKPVAQKVLSEYIHRFPGTRIEEKESCIAWHYRTAEKLPSIRQIKNLKNILGKIGTKFKTDILEGNQVIEIKDLSTNKGIAAGTLVKELNPDFILALGDDLTDEYLFRALPDHAYTIKVGAGNTQAKYCCVAQEDVIGLLRYFMV